MVGVPACVRWLMCYCACRSNVISVGDIAGNVGSELDSVVVFPQNFPRVPRFFHGYLNLKVFQNYFQNIFRTLPYSVPEIY